MNRGLEKTMARVSVEHVESTKKAVITAERSTNRGITDTLSCLMAMQCERTDARVFIDEGSIQAMQLITDSLHLQLGSQAKIAEAHKLMTGLIATYGVPSFGPSPCVPNTPGRASAMSEKLPVAVATVD
jgi:hypothetical protein